jgi:hypothetical protein
VKASARLRHARRCVLLLREGTLTRHGHSGANQLSFTGRIGRHSLTAGRYRLAVSAVDPSGNVSAARTVSFTIVKR